MTQKSNNKGNMNPSSKKSNTKAKNRVTPKKTGATSPKKARTDQKQENLPMLVERVAFGRLSNVRTVGSLATFAEIDTITRRDARSMASAQNEDLYCKRNRWQYYYGINTWMYLIQDICGESAFMRIDYLSQLLLNHGLVWVIKRCCEYAQLLVSERNEPHPMAVVVVGLPLQRQLQVLRFLKRFTPIGADQLDKAAVDGWVQVEDGVRQWHRHNELPSDLRTIVTAQVRAYICDWFKSYRHMTPNDAWLRGTKIPTGACLGKGFSKMEDRIMLFANTLQDPNRRYVCPFPANMMQLDRRITQKLDAFDSIEVEAARGFYAQKKDARTMHYRANRLVTVPKTYKSPRIVCPEAVVNQIMQRSIRDQMVERAPKWVRTHIPVEDQTVMEDAARAAFSKKLTTTDLSHASDSLATGAVLACFPAALAVDLANWRPTYTYLPGKDRPRRLEQFSTMGTGNVWYVMAVFLLACMCVACDYCGVPSTRKNLCLAFGDDMIHPDEITDDLYTILELFGFEINRDKSFGGSSRYRESCGSEWWQNEDGSVDDIRTIYYPRFPVACTDKGELKTTKGRYYDPLKSETVVTDTLSRFVAMQHAFYSAHCYNASRFLCDAIRTMYPQMTMSAAGNDLSQVTDLAGDFNLAKTLRRPMKGKAPMGTYCDPDTMLEYHLNERAGHACPVMHSDEADRDLGIQEWLYYQYLIFGPMRHSDPVLAMIGCTEPRTVVTGEPSVDWKVR